MNHQSTLIEHATKMKHDAAQQGPTTLISCSKRSPYKQLEIAMLNAMRN